MAITRRSFLAGLGSVSVGLLFRRQLDAVLDSLERELADEPVVADQLPSAAEIVVRPELAFRPDRLIVSDRCAKVFVLEDIYVGRASSLVGEIPAEIFAAHSLDAHCPLPTATPGAEIRFRVRYVGTDPAGARFQAALLGQVVDGGRISRGILSIDSMGPIVT